MKFELKIKKSHEKEILKIEVYFFNTKDNEPIFCYINKKLFKYNFRFY